MACSKTAFIEFKDCESSYLFEVELTPSTSYFYEITDKFGNVYQKAFTTDGDGYFSISPNDFPPYLFTNAGGNFTLIVKESLTDCGVVDFDYCEDTFDTIVFSFIKNADNSNAPVVDKCKKVYDCLGISDIGSESKFLNERGVFETPSGGGFSQVQADWNQTDNTEVDFIKNKPTNLATETYVNNALSSKADLVGGLVPASQLPSFVDDVLEYDNLAAFPVTGANGKIYVALDTNKTYRWTGSTYASLDEGIVLGETSSTAGRGDWVKTAYDWVIANGTNLLNHLLNTSNPHIVTASQVGAYTSSEVDTLLGSKASTSSVATVIFKSITQTIVTGKTAETSIYAIPLPMDGFDYMLKVYSQAQISTFAGYPITHRLRIGTYPSPIDGADGANSIGQQTALAIYAIGGATQFPVTRNFIWRGGVSGSIYGATEATNIGDDANSVALFSTLATKDFTTQHYLYVSFNPNNATAVVAHNQILVTLIKI
jgi:hypothetical protein